MISVNKFSFQGVKGAYSELAGKKLYPNFDSLACKTFEDMFEAVRNNIVNIALVPIENSRAGRVADTQRLIPVSKLKIIGEYFLEVNHCLLGLPGATLNDAFAGTMADIGGFSLNYHKHIHTGEGGILVTNDDELALRMRLIRNHAEAALRDLQLDDITGTP